MKQTMPGVYDLWLPTRPALPVLFDSPHSGSEYPADFESIAPDARLRRAEDMFVDRLFETAPLVGAVLLAAKFPRSYIDPNRAVDDIDRRVVEGAWPHAIRMTEKSRLGHGLIWRVCPPDIPMYGRKLSVAEVEARIGGYYRPYHRALRRAMDDIHDRFGCVFHVNCHSMPAISAPLVTDGRGGRRRADIVLGDRDGASCSNGFRYMVRDRLEDMGYAVAINDPYKGVELIRAYSDPAVGRHSLQLEISRSLYMDEDNFQPSAGFSRLKSDIEQLIVAICDYAEVQVLPRAAE